jgi:hypothetical protein
MGSGKGILGVPSEPIARHICNFVFKGVIHGLNILIKWKLRTTAPAVQINGPSGSTNTQLVATF